MISSRRARRDSLLFVYGTLRPFAAVPMARWLARVAEHLGGARTVGRLYDLGSYPGLRIVRGGESVRGDLYRVRRRSVLRALDRYEAGTDARRPRFRRRPAFVTSDSGRRRAAWLYVYARPILRRARIAQGDYRRALARASSPNGD
jgi:gamma-glutamylcyclotransferase (GGCT)/AIG2-like uncharacterized protein YtfP